MKLTVRSASLYTATLAGLLILSACGKSEQPAATQPAAASTAAAPAATSTAPTAPAPTSTAPAATPASASTAAATTLAATPPAATAPAAAAPNAFTVTNLAVGDSVNVDHKVRKSEDHFAPNQKTLYASVLTNGSTDGATLNASWRYLEGKGQLVSSISQRISTSGPATTTFKVENPNLWPEGKYKVDITLDGKQVASQNFEIKKR